MIAMALLQGVAQALIVKQRAVQANIMASITLLAAADVIARPRIRQPAAERHAEPKGDHLIVCPIAGITVGIGQMIANAIYRGIYPGRQAAFRV